MSQGRTWPKLAASQAEGGTHHHFAKLVGKWAGRAKTFFKPDEVGDDSAIEGEFRMGIDGHFLFHEYTGPHCGETMYGLETIGHNVDLGKLQMAWVNSCHTNSQIMNFEGEVPETPNPFSVSNLYKHAEDHPEWGWRIEYDLKDADNLVINHYNITPEGEESLAVEIIYSRQS